MDKLKGLLKQLGGSDDLISSISEEMTKYAQSIKAQYDAEFKDKINKARAICLEEVNKEKAELARKLAVYMESKQEYFERAAEKQRLNEESESANLLKRAKALLEGISVEDGGQSQELQVARRQLARLQQAVGSLKEERDLAVGKANKANQIAKDVLQKNRLLEGKKQSPVSESKKEGPSAPADSSKRTVLAESSKSPRPAPRRLDEERRVPSQSASTRRTIDEAQSKSSTKRPGEKHIAGIAASMEE